MTDNLRFVTGKPFSARDGVSTFIPVFLYSQDLGRIYTDQFATAVCNTPDGTGWSLVQCEPAKLLASLDSGGSYSTEEMIRMIEDSDPRSALPASYSLRIIQVRTVAGLCLYVDYDDSEPALVVDRVSATPMTRANAQAFLDDFAASGGATLPGLGILAPGDEIDCLYVEPYTIPSPEIGARCQVAEALPGSAVPKGYHQKAAEYLKQRCIELFQSDHT